MKRVLWLLETCLYIILSIPLVILPFRVSIKAGELLGILLFYLWGSRRKIAIENIERSDIAVGGSQHAQAKDIAKKTFKNLGRSFIEVLKIYYGIGKKIMDDIEVEGMENFEQAKSKGKGILFVGGHCGNWELLALAVSYKVSGTAVVARQINNPYLNKLVERIRQRYGNSIIYKKGALKALIENLRNDRRVGILMDQAVLPDEGYIIDFLGRGAWTTKMPALIARKTGAAVIPVFVQRTEKGHKLKIYPEIILSESDDKERAVFEDTKKFTRFIEDFIRENPTEWLWIHRRWKRAGQG